MIPINIDDPVVLRRTLEELETRIAILPTPITPVNTLDDAAVIEEIVLKTNEIVEGLNAVIVALNATNTSDKP